MNEEKECECTDPGPIYTVNGEWGYQEYCDTCKRKIEDGFHYYNEPELY